MLDTHGEAEAVVMVKRRMPLYTTKMHMFKKEMKKNVTGIPADAAAVCT